MSTARHLIISGRVQGVGYRAWLARTAEKSGVHGWVRNRDDGTVEAVIHGSEEQITRLIEKTRSGPLMAKVTGVIASNTDETPVENFSIKY